MNSFILQIAAKHIRWLMLLFAIIALFRGHNYPGGGFIGGLIAALGIMFSGFAYNSKKARNMLRIQPEVYIAMGLMMSLLSILPSVIKKTTLMTAIWLQLPLPVLGDLKLGTPLLFDIGVFFTVIGVTILFFFSLTQKE